MIFLITHTHIWSWKSLESVKNANHSFLKYKVSNSPKPKDIKFTVTQKRPAQKKQQILTVYQLQHDHV